MTSEAQRTGIRGTKPYRLTRVGILYRRPLIRRQKSTTFWYMGKRRTCLPINIRAIISKSLIATFCLLLTYASFNENGLSAFAFSQTPSKRTELLVTHNTSKRVPTDFSLGVYPPFTQIIVEAGHGTEFSFKVMNNGNPTIINTELTPFVAADDMGGVKIIDCDQNDITLCNFRTWFSVLQKKPGNDNKKSERIPVNKASFFIDSGETKQVTLRLYLPANTEPGDYTFSLLFTSQPPLKPQFSQNTIIGTVASNILITVPKNGKLEYSGKIVSFFPVGGINLTLGPWKIHLFDTFDQIPIILRLENNGQTAIISEGTITLNSPLFPEVKFTIPPQYVLADTVRNLNIKSLAFPNSIYLGHYRLKAQVELSPNQQPLIVSTAFWALPIKIISSLSLALLLFLLVKKLRKNSQISHSKKK